MKMKDNDLFSVRWLTQMGLFVALFVVAAVIRIPLPFTPVMLSLQNFFCLVAAVLLGGRRGALSFLCYIVLGLIGLPVFTNGGGIGYVLIPSFGFLIGMAISIPATSALLKRFGADFKGILIAGIAGFIIIYCVGLPYMYLILKLYLHSGNARIGYVLVNGCVIFLPLDALKIAVAAAVCPRLVSAVNRTAVK